MNTRSFFFFLLFVFIGFSLPVSSQSLYEVGALPTINFNKKLKQDWSVNFQYATRHFFRKGAFNSNGTTKYEFELSDYTLLAAKKIGIHSKVSSGFLYRRENGETIIRSIQQFAVVQPLDRFLLSHRFVTDQTFEKDANTTFRARYRIATEIPLNGDAADKNEFYVKLSNEYVNSWQNANYDLEVRFISMIGYTFANNQKLEFGLDYRVNSFVNTFAEHTFWTGINWYVQL